MRGAQAVACAILVFASVMAIVTAREWAEGSEEVAAADAAASRSDWAEAITRSRAAAEALAPGSPWPGRGWLRLRGIGHDAEARGDDATALASYSAMRAAALATEGIGAGVEVWRAEAEQGIARVAGSQRNLGPHVSAESTLDALRSSETPGTLTLAALSFASVAIFGGLGWLVLAGPGRTRAARVAQAIAGLGFAVYAAVLLSR
jgi:hypothetical protein